MKMKPFLFLLLAVIALAVTPAMSQDPGAIPDSDWPAETGVFKPGQGAELAQTLCMNCHSTEYVSTQPPMPRKFWEATVKKMKDKYAAPLPDDLTALVDYLAATYGK